MSTAVAERILDRHVTRRCLNDPAWVCATTEEDRNAREDEIEREELARLTRPGGMLASL
jgi:hypothetical protein